MKIFVSVCLALVLLASTAGRLCADEVPVKVTIRKGLNSQTRLVAQFSNASDKAISVQAAFLRPSNGRARAFTFTLPAKGWKEIGRTQGWSVHSGDQITVTADGYDDLHYHVH